MFQEKAPNPLQGEYIAPQNMKMQFMFVGDERVDENIALTSLHTLFLREHNRLARALRRLNQQWNNEQIYEEARKIMGAYHQVLYTHTHILKKTHSRLFPVNECFKVDHFGFGGIKCIYVKVNGIKKRVCGWFLSGQEHKIIFYKVFIFYTKIIM